MGPQAQRRDPPNYLKTSGGKSCTSLRETSSRRNGCVEEVDHAHGGRVLSRPGKLIPGPVVLTITSKLSAGAAYLSRVCR